MCVGGSQKNDWEVYMLLKIYIRKFTSTAYPCNLQMLAPLSLLLVLIFLNQLSNQYASVMI